MVGTTAQLIALACHFNARARGLRSGPFFSSDVTCKFCEYVHFVRGASIQTVDDWLRDEARPDRRAILTYESIDDGLADRLSAGFIGGGGQWLLSVVANGRRDAWGANWDVGNSNAPGQRIWQVTYNPLGEQAAFDLSTLPNPGSIIPALKQTLVDLIAFCRDHQIDNFGSCFQSAIDCLSSKGVAAYVRDIAPHGLLSADAAGLLAACQAAWVFGGMGSWNDMGFEGKEHERYERLSGELFSLVNRGISAAASSSAGL